MVACKGAGTGKIGTCAGCDGFLSSMYPAFSVPDAVVLGCVVGLYVSDAEKGVVGNEVDKKLSGTGGTHSLAATEGTPHRQYLPRQHSPESHSSPAKHGVIAKKSWRF